LQARCNTTSIPKKLDHTFICAFNIIDVIFYS
jgi:hypothetical protein